MTLLASYSARQPHRPTMCLCDATPRHDPSGTSGIRRRYEADLVKRFKRIRALIYEAVVKNDVLGQGVSAQMFQKSFSPTMLARDEAPPAQAFAFRQSGEKVGSFMAWLKQQQNEGILQVTTGTAHGVGAEWQQTYIRAAYTKGVRDAGERMRESGADVSDRWISAAFDRPIHADRIGLAYVRAFDDLEGITAEMDRQISRTLASGLAGGKGPMAIAREITSRVDAIGITRARLLARTEVMRAHSQATVASYREAEAEGVRVMAEFSTSGDDQVCEVCAALEGKEYTLDQAESLLPIHPNCLPGDSLVFAGSGVSAASKRWFDGDVIIIRTASNRELSATPNHPVLTPIGWKAIGLIAKGDDVICDGSRDWSRGAGTYDENVPAMIHEIADAVFRSGEMKSMPVPVSAPHFHGDGIDGDVAYIGAFRDLKPKSHADLFKMRPKIALVMADVMGRLSTRIRSIHKLIKSSLSSTSGLVRGGYLRFSSVIAHLRPLECFGGRMVTNFHAGFDQSFSNGISGYASAARYGFLAFSGNVRIDAPSKLRVVDFAPRHHVGSENPGDDLVSDAKLARDICDGATGPVFSDKVVSVVVKKFAGHVYNLQTGNGSYIAQGIVTHNCRCILTPVVRAPENIRLT